MDSSTKTLFTIEEQLSGYLIFYSIEDSASAQKSDWELDLLYIQWMSINRNNNESIRAFAVRVQIDAAKFDGTDYEVKPKALAHSWRKGIGSDFQSINNMVD